MTPELKQAIIKIPNNSALSWASIPDKVQVTVCPYGFLFWRGVAFVAISNGNQVGGQLNTKAEVIKKLEEIL